jgi:O-antigen biosynthesis protein
VVVVKVLFVTANYPPEALGGTEQVVSALAREYGARGHEVVVVSGSDVASDVEVRTDEVDGIVVHRISRRFGEYDHHGFLRPRIVSLVRGLLERHQPDVVHVHSFAVLGVGLTSLCRERGIRVVVTFHDLWVACARYFRLPRGGATCPTGPDRAACVPCVNDSLGTDPEIVRLALGERDRLLRAEVALATLCTAPSRTAAAFVRDTLPYTGPIEVVPHGLVRVVPAAHRAPPPTSGEPLRVGTFGGLVREKGILELVAAVGGLGCELHLAGPFHEPTFEAEVRGRARADGTRLVVRSRYAEGSRHPARDLHLAVFPSLCQESYGLVVDEALAHGVPAVLSEGGAFRERRGQPGVVVTPVDRLAATLHELVASPARLAAQRDVIPATLPTIAASAVRHLELYQRLS